MFQRQIRYIRFRAAVRNRLLTRRLNDIWCIVALLGPKSHAGTEEGSPDASSQLRGMFNGEHDDLQKSEYRVYAKEKDAYKERQSRARS